MPKDGMHYPNHGKPVSIGPVFNVELVLVDDGTLIYQWHTGSVMSVSTVRDGGHALAFSADYPDRAALAAATMEPGHYATCNAEGLVRVWTCPVFQLRLDGHGAAGIVELYAAMERMSRTIDEQSRKIDDLSRQVQRLGA